MSRFKFLISQGDGKDESVDTDLPDIQAAWAEAVRFCGESLEDLDGAFGLPDVWLVTVSDHTGAALFELRCTSRHFH